MGKISPRKVYGTSVDGFTETVMFEVLACGNIDNNNNKFYCIELQRNPTTDKYRLFTHYGRIGHTNVYEVRDGNSDHSSFEAEYHRIVKSKKKVTAGKSTYETVDTQTPSVGSDNIRNTTSTCSTGTAKTKGDLSLLKLFSNQYVKDMVRMVWEENIHNITNLTTMKVTSSGISSPLGPLTIQHIDRSLVVLNAIKDAYDNKHDSISTLNAKYFSMIPHPFGSRIPSDAMITDDNKFMVEFDLLEQMKSAIQVGGEEATDDQLKDIGVDIQLVEKGDPIWLALERQYVESRADCHRHLSRWNVRNIFEVDHKNSTKNYDTLDSKFLKEEYHLFHGSRACNILSIMMNGLMVPPKTAGHVTGRMFGDGIYAASASTKALNYATGYWAGGARNKHNYAYMFVVQFAMGNIYYPDRTLYNGPPSGYDSVHAKKGRTGLANDEYIVYNTKQAKITHLLQLEER